MARFKNPLWRRVKMYGQFLFIFILLGSCFSYAMFQGGFVSWFLLYSFLPFVLYTIIVLITSLNVEVERMVEPKVFYAGDTIQVQLKIKRKYPIPFVFMLVEDLLSDDDYGSSSKRLFFPCFRRSFIFTYELKHAKRGELTFEAVRVMTSDPLGLFKKEFYRDAQMSLLIYPKMEDIVYRPLQTRFEQGRTLTSLHYQKDLSLVAGVRQYQPGDRFSWIDWKATARTNELKAKEFENRQTNDLLFTLDRHTENGLVFEEMVRFTASAIKAIMQHGGQTGLLSIGGDKAFFPIRNGEYHEREMFMHLAKVQPDAYSSLYDVIEREPYFHQQRAVKVIVTGTLDPSLFAKLNINSGTSRSILLFYVRVSRENLTKQELNYMAVARQKGILVQAIHSGQFRNVFMDVGQI